MQNPDWEHSPLAGFDGVMSIVFREPEALWVQSSGGRRIRKPSVARKRKTSMKSHNNFNIYIHSIWVRHSVKKKRTCIVRKCFSLPAVKLFALSKQCEAVHFFFRYCIATSVKWPERNPLTPGTGLQPRGTEWMCVVQVAGIKVQMWPCKVHICDRHT